MTGDVEVLSVDQAVQWREAHRDGGLPSQSWEYAMALRASGIDARLAIVRVDGARMLLPHFERDWMGAVDIATLVASCGASISPASAAPLALWQEYAAARGWVAGYIQLATTTVLPRGAVAGQLVDLNEWFVLDLTGDLSPARFATLIRRKIRRAEEDGASLVEDVAGLARACIAMYPAAMRRVGAGSRYGFAGDTIAAWASAPGTLLLGAELDGRIEAVSMFLVAGERAEYHLNASSDRGRALAAWLIWHGARRLAGMGVRWLHLGGGVRAGDGLHEFKRKFRGAPVAVRAVRQVYDAERFRALCAQAGVDPAASPYHPAYRFPAATDATA